MPTLRRGWSGSPSKGDEAGEFIAQPGMVARKAFDLKQVSVWPAGQFVLPGFNYAELGFQPAQHGGIVEGDTHQAILSNCEPFANSNWHLCALFASHSQKCRWGTRSAQF
jgi:hypothetical protein